MEALAPIGATMFGVRGQPISTISGKLDDVSGTWGDDSLHLCVLSGGGQVPTSPSDRAELGLFNAPTGTLIDVGGVTAPSTVFWRVDACSLTSGRAVLVGDTQEGVRAISVVQLSARGVVHAADHAPSTPPVASLLSNVVVSGNASIAVEVVGRDHAQLFDPATGTTRLWPAGSAALTEVLGLSWMGRRALTAQGVVDLTTGRLVWLTPSVPTGVRARPGSDDLLVTMPGSEVIVRGDGSHVDLGPGS